MKKFRYLFSALALVGGFYLAWHMYSKPVEDASSGTPALSITADELMRAYDADENNANQSYLGKMIEVSGIVSDQSDLGTGQIFLETENPLVSIICTLSKPDASIQVGQSYDIRGFVTGYLSDVILDRAVVVKK